MKQFALETKPDLEQCLQRVWAWYEGEMLDRPPVRFSRHNEEYDSVYAEDRQWATVKDRWFDAEFQLERFAESVRRKRFLGETFPVYWPNLGPNVFAACFGCKYKFGEVTAWAEPVMENLETIPQMDWDSVYFKKLNELTDLALQRAKDQFLVGYTDLHPGLDWCDAMRGTQALMMDLYDEPEQVIALAQSCLEPFFSFYDHFDAKSKEHDQLSVTWMNIPSPGKMHIPSCDFSSMISGEAFQQFAFEGLSQECMHMDHNIFHMDGKGVARHLETILALPKLHAIQWVQGVGEDAPIAQWIPMIRRIQAAGKGVVVDLAPHELEMFMDAVSADGIYLCISTEDEQQERAILKRIEKW